MHTKENFANLSANRIFGRAYIASNGQEPHYRFHVKFVEHVFGSNVRFEQVAAVTEIFLCATKDMGALPSPGSPCADLYFEKIVSLLNPAVIVGVGGRVMAYLKTRSHEHGPGNQLFLKFKERNIPAVRIPHPADPNLSESWKLEQLSQTATTTRRLLKDGSNAA